MQLDGESQISANNATASEPAAGHSELEELVITESDDARELAHLRKLVGPNQQSYEELRYELIRLQGEYQQLERQAGLLRGENAFLQSENGSLSFRAELAFRERDLVLRSKPYRLGRILTAPARLVRRALRRR